MSFTSLPSLCRITMIGSLCVTVFEFQCYSCSSRHPKRKDLLSPIVFYNCFFAWSGDWSFFIIFQRRHLAHKCHAVTLKNHGVSHLLRDESKSPTYQSDQKCDGKYIPLNDYIVLDEVGESDDEERPKDDVEEDSRPGDGQPERGSPKNQKRKIRYANGNVADQVTLSLFAIYVTPCHL